MRKDNFIICYILQVSLASNIPRVLCAFISLVCHRRQIVLNTDNIVKQNASLSQMFWHFVKWNTNFIKKNTCFYQQHRTAVKVWNRLLFGISKLTGKKIPQNMFLTKEKKKYINSKLFFFVMWYFINPSWKHDR